jgi:hypothetical protein
VTLAQLAQQLQLIGHALQGSTQQAHLVHAAAVCKHKALTACTKKHEAAVGGTATTGGNTGAGVGNFRGAGLAGDEGLTERFPAGWIASRLQLQLQVRA